MANSDNPTTVSAWSQGLLNRLGITAATVGPVKWRASLAVVSVWALKEGGHFHNSAKFNPLNTTQRMPGSTSINKVGVQAYTSWEQGYTATITTLRNGRYDALLEDLKNGHSYQFTQDLARSPWGTGTIIDPKGNLPSASMKPGAVANTIQDAAQAASDAITGDTTSADYTQAADSAVPGAVMSGAVLTSASTLLTTLNSPAFWKRLGIGVAGAVVIILAVLVMVWAGKDKVLKSTVGAAVGSAVKGK